MTPLLKVDLYLDLCDVCHDVQTHPRKPLPKEEFEELLEYDDDDEEEAVEEYEDYGEK